MEIISHSYSHIYEVPTTILDFYSLWTWGRPDMALFKFTKNILKGLPLTFIIMVI